MADNGKGLPVRTDIDPDGLVRTKHVDFTTPTQGNIVDTDGNSHVEMHGNDPVGTDRVVRTSEQGALTPDGVYDVANNTKPGNVGVIVHTRNATPGAVQQGLRQTGIQNSTVIAADVAIRDASGAVFSETNPLPVIMVDVDPLATSKIDYNTASALAAAATSNHDYTVTAAKTFYCEQVILASSGEGKYEIQASVATVFSTFAVVYLTKAEPSKDIKFARAKAVAATEKLRIIRTNKDLVAMDVYSTIIGIEI